MQPTGLNAAPGPSVLGSATSVLALAEAARWRGPDVTAALAEHAAALAAADGDRAVALRAEGWLAHGMVALGQGWAVAPRAAAALAQADRLGHSDAADRLRIELAVLARSVDAPGPAQVLLDTVLERPRLGASPRADACLEAALAPDRPEREAAGLLDEAVAAFRQVGGEAGLLGLAHLDGAVARRHRERGEPSPAIARARDGLGKVLGDRLAGGELEPVSPRLALMLCAELCVALADSGSPGPIREVATPMLEWSLTPATAEPASVLRLALASRVYWPARDGDAALAEAGRVADTVAGRQLPELEAEAQGLLAEIHESRRALTAALQYRTRAHDALRRHGARVEQARALLAQVARDQRGPGRVSGGGYDDVRPSGGPGPLPSDSLLSRVTEPVRNGFHAPTERVPAPYAGRRNGHPSDGHHENGYRENGYRADGRREDGLRETDHRDHGYRGNGHPDEGPRDIGYRDDDHPGNVRPGTGYRWNEQRDRDHGRNGHRANGHPYDGHPYDGDPYDGNHGDGRPDDGQRRNGSMHGPGLLEPLPPPRPAGDRPAGRRRAPEPTATEPTATEPLDLPPAHREPSVTGSADPGPAGPGSAGPGSADTGPIGTDHRFEDLLAGTPLDSARPAPPPTDTMTPDQIFARITDDGEFAGWESAPAAAPTSTRPSDTAPLDAASAATEPIDSDPAASPITGRRRRPESDQPREAVAATAPALPVHPVASPSDTEDDDLDVLWLSPQGADVPQGPAWLTPRQLGDRLTELAGEAPLPPAHLVVVDIAAADDDSAATLAEVAVRVADRIAEQVPPHGQLFLMEPVTVTVALAETDQQAVSRWVRTVSAGLTQNWEALAAGAPRAMFRVAVRPLDRAWTMREHVSAVEQRLHGATLGPDRPASPRPDAEPATPAGRLGPPRGRHDAGRRADDGEPPTTRFEARPGSGGRRRRPDAIDGPPPSEEYRAEEPLGSRDRRDDGLAGLAEEGLRLLRDHENDERDAGPGPGRRTERAAGHHGGAGHRGAAHDPGQVSAGNGDEADRTDPRPATEPDGRQDGYGGGEPAAADPRHGAGEPAPDDPHPGTAAEPVGAADPELVQPPAAARPPRPPAYDRPVSELTFAELIDGALAAYREA